MVAPTGVPSALLVAVLAVPLVAGCLGALPDGAGGASAPAGDADGAGTGSDRTVLHTADGPVAPGRAADLAKAGLADVVTRIAPTGHRRGEPTVGVRSDGTIWTVGEGGAAITSTDHGRTWTVADDPVTRPKPDIDPFLWVDPDTDRVYNSRLHVAATWLSWTDDAGATWTFNPVAGLGTPGHDHQKLTTGPPPDPLQPRGYPNVLYYVYNGAFRGLAGGPAEQVLDGTWVSVSYDGGRTFPVERQVHRPDCRSGIAAPAAVGPEGTVYVPKHTCDGVAVAVSEDAGETWDVRGHLTSVGTGSSWVLDPMASVDDNGTAYVVWQGADALVYLAWSADRGRTWSDPVRVTAPDVGGTAFPDVVAGADGRVAVAYLGTTSNASAWDDHDPSHAPDDVVWHAYLTFLPDARAQDPVMTSHRVTPDDDPVQRGCIWHHGGSNPCRNLRDFMDMVHHEGRTYLVYPDGCQRCETANDSHALGETTVAIVGRGPSLLGDVPVRPLADPAGDGSAPAT